MKKIITLSLIVVLLVGCNNSIVNDKINANNGVSESITETNNVSNIGNAVENTENENMENEGIIVNEEESSIVKNEIIIFSEEKEVEDYIRDLCNLDITLNHETGRNYLIAFQENMIRTGEVDGEFFSTEFWDSVEVNIDEKSLLFHIYEAETPDYDTLESENTPLDFYSKLIFNDDTLDYYNKFGTVEVKRSTWMISEKEWYLH